MTFITEELKEKYTQKSMELMGYEDVFCGQFMTEVTEIILASEEHKGIELTMDLIERVCPYAKYNDLRRIESKLFDLIIQTERLSVTEFMSKAKAIYNYNTHKILWEYMNIEEQKRLSSLTEATEKIKTVITTINLNAK